MINNDKCIFCNNNCKITPPHVLGCQKSLFNCDICGNFQITQTALAHNPPRCLPKISAVLKHKTLIGAPLLTIGTERTRNFVTVKDLEKEYPEDDTQRVGKVLENLRKLSKNKGASIKVGESSYSIFFTDNNSVESLFYALDDLSGEGYITRETGRIPDTIKLIAKGWKEQKKTYNNKETVLLAIYEEEQNNKPNLVDKITYSALNMEPDEFYVALQKLINKGFIRRNKVKFVNADDAIQNVYFSTTVMTEDGDEYAKKLLTSSSKGSDNQETEVNTKEIEIDTKSFDFWQLIHPEICKVVKNKFEDGYYADAVETALKHINKRVKDIVKNDTGKELDGASLMQKAFSVDQPIIKLNNLSDETEKNIQKGYLQIFSGVMTGIRNPKAHDNLSISRENGIHLIFLASLLMHKLDKAF